MMTTTRLRNVYQHEQRQRKFVCVMNDVAKTRQDRYDHFIDAEKAEATQRSNNAIEHTRKNIVRQKVLKKCMQNKREEVEKKQASTIYGKYHGESVEHITGQIDSYMEHNHPRVRKAQKIRNLFEEGYQKGAILDKDTVKTKVKRFFDKPLVELHRIQELDESSSKDSAFLPPLGSNFYSGNISNITRDSREIFPQLSNNEQRFENSTPENEGNKLFVKRNVRKFWDENVPDDLSLRSNNQTSSHRQSKEDTRPVTLPMIKPVKDQTDVSRPVKGTIAELAAQFAKSKEKAEKLQRKMMQPQASKKVRIDKKTRHLTSHRKPESRRPKSDKTGIKEAGEMRQQVKDGQNKAGVDISDNDPLSLSLPPIKFKNSSMKTTY